MDETNQRYIDWWLAENAARVDGEEMFFGHMFFIPSGVFSFSERLTHSSTIAWKHTGDVRGARVLDLGTGTGVLGITALLNGAASVVLTDTDESALEAARANAGRHRLNDKVSIVQSNLFSNVEGQFDVIFANLPLADAAWNLDQSISTITERFYAEAKNHLAPSGRIITSSASFANTDGLREVVTKSGYILREFTEKKFDVDWHALVLKLGNA